MMHTCLWANITPQITKQNNAEAISPRPIPLGHPQLPGRRPSSQILRYHKSLGQTRRTRGLPQMPNGVFNNTSAIWSRKPPKLPDR